jgi:hypothetical protein
MPKRPPPTSVYLTASQRERLRALSARFGTPQSVLVRRGVENVLAAAERADAVLQRDPELRKRLTPLETVLFAGMLGASLPAALEPK